MQENSQQRVPEAGGPRDKSALIDYLEKNLDTQEKKIAKLQNDYDILHNENTLLARQQKKSGNSVLNTTNNQPETPSMQVG